LSNRAAGLVTFKLSNRALAPNFQTGLCPSNPQTALRAKRKKRPEGRFFLHIPKKSSTFVADLRVYTGVTIMNEFLEREEAILKMLKTVFDPEIPVNIYDLGLIYGIEIKDDGLCEITMTLTAPSCPAGDFLVEDIRQKVGSVEGIKDVNVNIVFEPEWTKDMMSEEAKLELGFL
jgi:FeS assembly SUF system protein